MPEVHVELLWPDGSEQRCTSPSRAIEGWLVAGARYPADELLRRVRSGLGAASERVREVYGMGCTSAAAELEAIERRVADLETLAWGAGGRPAGTVLVKEIRRDREEAPPSSVDLGGHHQVVIVGGGQAGLAMSFCLLDRGVDHLVLERDRVAHAWREERWDSFSLVTPNWQCRLPGHPLRGADPDGFIGRDEIADYVESYARKFALPVREGVGVEEVALRDDGAFDLTTTAGDATADAVVLAVGGYHAPSIPRLGAALSPDITQLHSSTYRNPSSLPDGAVLVVGSGQSGAQIAEDLHLAGRDVHLAVGTAPRVARFYRGRDVVTWLHDMGHFDLPIERHPEGLDARREANHYVTGRDGGRDLDLRELARDGMTLHGRLIGGAGGDVRFAGDLADNLDAADETYERINGSIDEWIDEHGVEAPPGAAYEPVWAPDDNDGGGELDLAAAGVRSVVWATGFSSDWSWVKAPAFDGTGYPTHHRGVTTVPGLYVLGLPWLHTWGSGRFAGIARDARHLAAQIPAGAAARAA